MGTNGNMTPKTTILAVRIPKVFLRNSIHEGVSHGFSYDLRLAHGQSGAVKERFPSNDVPSHRPPDLPAFNTHGPIECHKTLPSHTISQEEYLIENSAVKIRTAC
jgi:hypothetical protein